MGAAISIVFLACAAALVWMAMRGQREMRRRAALQAELHAGDEVMTTSGIYGSVREVTDDHVWLEVAPDTVVKLARRAVAARVSGGDAPDGAGAPGARPTDVVVDHDADAAEG
ncbi:MAG TPA: preprotein translocase subunit YajC [Acidimicrobiales bacterium]|nr:preprotein translocase subunit YajC [Acidimicrobiales bacterium]